MAKLSINKEKTEWNGISLADEFYEQKENRLSLTSAQNAKKNPIWGKNALASFYKPVLVWVLYPQPSEQITGENDKNIDTHIEKLGRHNNIGIPVCLGQMA